MIKYCFLLFTAVLLIYCGSHKSIQNDPLVGSKWKFIGFIHLDSMWTYPDDYNFTLEFRPNNKIYAEAFEHHSGKYKIKKDKIYIQAWITVSYSSDLELLKGGSGLAMQLKRRYQSGLLMDKYYHFEIKNDELRINSDWGLMIFKKL